MLATLNSQMPIAAASQASAKRSLVSNSFSWISLRSVMSWIVPTSRTTLPSSVSAAPTARTQIARPLAVTNGSSRSHAVPCAMPSAAARSITGRACGAKKFMTSASRGWYSGSTSWTR